MSSSRRGRRRRPNVDSVDTILARCSADDFRERSEFQRLSPEQRLDWLHELAEFVHEFRGKATGRGRGE